MFEEIGQPIIYSYQATDKFNNMKQWVNQYGVWFVLLAGVTPIPYKISTIGSGFLRLAFIPFLIASVIGGGGKFYLVTTVLWLGGEQIDQLLKRWMEWIVWGLIALAVLAYFFISQS